MSAAEDEDGECAMTRVFNTVELCEDIFTHLPLLHLISRAPLVCKHWKAVIDGSIKLQQQLFFEPTDDFKLRGRLKIDGVHSYERLTYNPFKNTILPDMRLMPRDLSVIKDSTGWEERLARNEASWRRMLFCQPPRSSIYGDDGWYQWRFTDSEAAGLDGKGLRLGQVLKIMETRKSEGIPWSGSDEEV